MVANSKIEERGTKKKETYCISTEVKGTRKLKMYLEDTVNTAIRQHLKVEQEQEMSKVE